MAPGSRRRGGGCCSRGAAAAASPSSSPSSSSSARVQGVARRAGGPAALALSRAGPLLVLLALQLLVLAHRPAAAASAGAKGIAWWLRPFQGAGGRNEGAGAAGLDVDPNAEGPQRRWWGVVRRGGAVRSGGGRASGKGGKGAGKKKDNTPSAGAAADAGMLVGKKKGGGGSTGGGRGELDPSESEDEMGALVIGPEAGGAGRAAADDEDVGPASRPGGGVGVEVEEEAETEDALVGYASGDGDDDDEGGAAGGGDDDGLGGEGEDDGPGRWSYLEELEEEEEPEWVAAYAALEESIEDPPQAQRVSSREEARAILRQAWARLAIPPQGEGEAATGAAAAAAGGAAAAEGEEGEVEVDGDGVHYPGSPFARQSKAAARRELYKRFLKDLRTDTRALGGRHWLDRDALVHLRGTALLCQRPEYRELLASLHPRFCRGVRLVVPTATHGIQEALAAALAHSVGAVLVVADHRRIAAVRRIALDAGVPKRFLGSEMVMGALLDLARGEEKGLLVRGRGRRGVPASAAGEDGGEEEEEELSELDEEEEEENEEDEAASTKATAGSSAHSSSPPLVIFLADKARPFLQTRGVAGALQSALQARDASSFFLLSSEYDPDSQLPPLPQGGNGGHAHGGHHHPHPHFGAAGGLLAPPGSNLLSGEGALPNMTTLLGGGQSGGNGGGEGNPQQQQQQQQGGGPPRFGPQGLPGLVMPWPGMPHAPNGFNKGGPVLHVLIRPNLVPSPNANGAGAGAGAGNGSVGVHGYVPGVPGASLGSSPNPNAPPPGVAGFSPLFKRTVAELAEHFHELSRERLGESQGQGAGAGAAAGAPGQAKPGGEEEGPAGGPAGAAAGEEDKEEDEDEDEDEDEEDVDSQEYKDRAAAEGSALSQLAAMLEMLNSNENFHRALQAHVNAQHQHLQHMGLHGHGGPGGPMGMGMPPPPGGGSLRPPPPPAAPGGPGGPPQMSMGPDGVPILNGVPMLPAYQITFAFPPLNTQPPPRASAAAAAATPPAAASALGGQQQQPQQDGKGLPFARWFGKNRGDAAAAAEENGSGSTGGRRGKRKGGRGSRGSSGGGSSSSSKEAAPAPSELPLSGAEQEELLALFDDVVLQPTKDAALRARWDRLVADDHERYNAKRAWAILRHALGMHRLLCPDLARANPLLYKVQLKPGAEVGKVMAAAVEVDVSRRPLPRVVTEDGAFHLVSLEALETGLAMVCKASVPRPGTPVSRTKEEVTALAQNRHEHALVSNVISPADIGVTYDQIGGLEDVKETLRQCVTYPLRFPHLYAEGIAADSVKGVLLFGPPGTGKTMLAKAVATEGGATFLSVDASVIESKWLGESEKNAKAVFTLARRLAPCVIYLDEVDSILSSRDQGEDTKYNTITSVKTTFMQEWDGLRTTQDRVIVVASTNRPYALDQAVLRRMPRRILVDLPDQATREEMLRVILQRNRVAPEVNLTAIARRLDGYTGSDIREVCREAVVRIAHEESKKLDDAQQGVVASVDALGKRLRPVTKADFDAALEKLSASVAARGRELERVREWNSQFGEVRKKQKPPHLSMYL